MTVCVRIGRGGCEGSLLSRVSSNQGIGAGSRGRTVSLNLPSAHSRLPLKDVGYVRSRRYAAMNRKTISLLDSEPNACQKASRALPKIV